MEPSSLSQTEANREVVPDPSTDDPDRDPVEVLADEFIARRRLGETPSLDEYAARCPDRAEEIRELFPAIAAMERWKPRPSTPRQRLGGGPIRERIGEYRLIREIGRGGMGIVYEAEQTALGRRVAIKALPGIGLADDRPIRRFLREAQTTASLGFRNIVPVFDYGREDELHYFVMPLIQGLGLDRIIVELRERKNSHIVGSDFYRLDLVKIVRTCLDRSNSSRAIDLPELDDSTPRGLAAPEAYWRGLAVIGRQVAEALRHAHEAGILHRDIKPANLLLDVDGVVWVTDFGLAKAMTHDDLSRTGDLVGTLRYMAPERFQGLCDARSDLYSLGLTLYELIALRPAHEVSDRAALIKKIAEAAPARPTEHDPLIPIDLETIVLKAIDPDPDRRYATAEELAEDLSRFADGRPVLARRAALPERLGRLVARNRMLACLIVLILGLSLFSSYFFRLWLYAPPGPRPGGPPRFSPDGRLLPPDGPQSPPPLRRPPPPPPRPPWEQ